MFTSNMWITPCHCFLIAVWRVSGRTARPSAGRCTAVGSSASPLVVVSWCPASSTRRRCPTSRRCPAQRSVAPSDAVIIKCWILKLIRICKRELNRFQLINKLFKELWQTFWGSTLPSSSFSCCSGQTWFICGNWLERRCSLIKTCVTKMWKIITTIEIAINFIHIESKNYFIFLCWKEIWIVFRFSHHPLIIAKSVLNHTTKKEIFFVGEASQKKSYHSLSCVPFKFIHI